MINLKSGILFLVLALGMLLLSGCSSEEKTQELLSLLDEPPESFDYQQLLDDSVSEHVPGIALLVESPSHRFLGSAGLADVDSNTAMQPYHVMPAGSAGKQVTALLATMLAEQSMLNLDASINHYLPQAVIAAIENGDDITLRQLLNHTSGVFNYLENESGVEFYGAVQSSPGTLITDEFALAFGLDQPSYFAPGEGWTYSNTNYLLAGLILDSVLGEHHSKSVRTQILEPLGLTSTHYNGVEQHLGDIISGYYTSPQLPVINTRLLYNNIGTADAPIATNVEDLALILKAIVATDGQFNELMGEQMVGDDNLVHAEDNKYYGLGIYKESVAGKTIYYHNGSELGYSARNYYVVETQTSITALINCGLFTECEVEVSQFINRVLENEILTEGRVP